jgi:hypothetical protein
MLGKFLTLNATEILIMGEQAMKLFQQTFAIATAARARNQFFSKVIAHYA